MQEKPYYHYTTIEGLKGILENKCLWATGIEFLNDPTENNYLENLISQICSKNPSFQEVYDHLSKETYKRFFFDPIKYIISMSNSQDSLSMWNLYSKGNGYCIKFKNQSVFIYKYDTFVLRTIHVIYDEKKQIEYLKDIFESYIPLLPEIKELEVQMEKATLEGEELKYQELNSLLIKYTEDFRNALYKNKNNYKHPAYKDEFETRIIAEYDDSEDFPVKFRSTVNGQLIEYIEIPIHIENIEAIMLHPLISDEIHITGLRRFLNNMGLHDVRINKSKIPFRIL
jgi:hypothetical protein